MATLRKEVTVRAAPQQAWQAVRDFGAVHRRLVPGFVLACTASEGERLLTFANGIVARERLVGIDEAERRLAYSAVSERLTHHNGALQVLAAEGGGSRLVWTIDLLPDAMAGAIGGMMDDGISAMRRAFGAAQDGDASPETVQAGAGAPAQGD